MSRIRVYLLTIAIFSATVIHARAHFLFIRIIEPAKDKRAAEVYFSDTADAGDPTYIKKIAGTKLWLQTKPGKFEPLKIRAGEDRLTTNLPNSGSLVVVGVCRYGVLSRKTPFLLRHFPKAMIGSAKELSAMKAFGEIPLEIVGTKAGDKLRITVLLRGKPVPGAEIWTLDKKLRGGKLQCNKEGVLNWKPPRPGWYMVYSSDFKNESGTFRGKAYRQIRDFATLSFYWPDTSRIRQKSRKD